MRPREGGQLYFIAAIFGCLEFPENYDKNQWFVIVSQLMKKGANMPEAATWRFRKMEDDQKHVEPTHREHLATGGLVEPLVREAIQNSLDATVDGNVTKVTFTLGQAKASDAETYFDTLRPHLEAIKRSLAEGLPDPNESVSFLAIEDYNTRGLEGDPNFRKQVYPDGRKNHFFRFWHSVGQSSGDFKRRGSWGVGKVVFSNASRIRTFFGLTCRTGDEQPLLMGEAGLTIHPLEGDDTVYDWYGYYAAHEPRRDYHIPMPVQDQESISKFTRVFDLTRTASGLSILVPYVREGMRLDEIARAVIEQYFVPILAGRLEVTVRSGNQLINVTSATIDAAVGQVTWPKKGVSTQDEIKKLLDIARWQISLAPSGYTALSAIDPPYVLEEARFPSGILPRLSDDYALGKRVAFRIPVKVRAKNGAIESEEVRLVLERDDGLRASNVPHLRSGINISKLREQCGAGVRGLLVVGGDDSDTQGALDKLIQASEGPSHINWEQRGEGYDKARSLFDDAHKVIGFMRHLVRNVVELLVTPPDTQDTRTLSMFFPDYETDGIARGNGSLGHGGPGNPEPQHQHPPASVIHGIVREFVKPVGLKPVRGAVVDLLRLDAIVLSTITDDDGKFRFKGLGAGEYTLFAKKENCGQARCNVVLPPEHGVEADLVLRSVPAPRMFVKVTLDNGFAIRGNPEYAEPLRPIRIRMAYAAWGGKKSFTEADFSLADEAMQISFSGVAESQRSELVAAPNILRFTPITNDFRVEVRGFDSNRALHADARVLDDVQIEQEVFA